MKTNHNDYMVYIEERLSQWAEWFSRGNWYGIGYSHRSIEHRLMTEGVLTKSTADDSIGCNEDAEEIERLVNVMSKQNFPMASALRCHYFKNGGLRVKAKMNNISHMQFKYYVDMAHQWLAGCLCSKKIGKTQNACNVNTKRV